MKGFTVSAEKCIVPPSSGPKILCLDIETSPHLASVWGLFDQNISLSQLRECTRVICWAAKWHGRPGVEFRSDHHDGHTQQIKRMHDLLDEADIVTGWNHRGFDLKHLNREFVLMGLAPPAPYVTLDLMLEVKKHFRFASNKLDHVSRQLGLGQKVSNGGQALWDACLIQNDPSAWEKMRKYNVQDTRLTEKVFDAIKPWLKMPNVALITGKEGLACTSCGSTSVVKRGYSISVSGKYQRYVCKKCGKFSKGTQRLATTELRPL